MGQFDLSSRMGERERKSEDKKVYFCELEEEIVAGIADDNDFGEEFVRAHGVGVAVSDFVEELEDFECLFIVLELQIDILHKFFGEISPSMGKFFLCEREDGLLDLLS